MFEIPSTTNSAIDFNYRPQSYFFPMELNKFLLSSVKGTERRRDIERLIREGNEAQIPDWLAHSALNNKTREMLGSIHPKFMGGEYLDDLKAFEVEIARIELASVTSDVISIRARKSKGRIYYRVLDEYETVFKITPRWSKYLLSLGQLIQLIETATDKQAGEHSLGLRFLDECYTSYGYDLDDCLDFMRVTSAFYPDLERYYAEAIALWYGQCVNELEEDEDEQLQ
jgi:hypothetical protein